MIGCGVIQRLHDSVIQCLHDSLLEADLSFLHWATSCTSVIIFLLGLRPQPIGTESGEGLGVPIPISGFSTAGMGMLTLPFGVPGVSCWWLGSR